ncbi:MAG TPA: TonB-dependent receptor [Candidatus Acidoferrales bacterium]|nr:TonB-dependent receptor [Candidatus Acidoferrales bacterium]
MFYSANRMIRRALLFLGMVSLLAIQSALAAGTGTLKGKVFDATTKDALPGATVLVKGTSVGASTDLNGDFLVHNAPSGNQSVVVSYIGYTPITVTVDIPDGETLTKDFYLEATAVQGKVVVVTAQAQGQIQAINQQLASNKIANVVSEARIQELPDFNAAAAIGRLPGVSTLKSSGEDDKVVIRGLAPQYNEVAVSGVTLAATGSNQIGATSHITSPNPANSIDNDRSVDLTMITPYMIKSIEVYKTLTPDMNANAIGGFVDMSLREAPSGLHGDALWQSGYTEKSNTYGNYRAVASASDRFFNDMLGVYVLGNMEQYDRNADNMTATYTSPKPDSVEVNTVGLQRHLETRKRYGANLILDYSLPSGSIKSVNMISRLNSNYQDYQENLDYSTVTKLLAFTYGAGNDNTDLAINTLNITNDFGFMSVELLAANTYSRNHLPSFPDFQFQQQQSYPPTPLNTPPEGLINETKYAGDSVTTLTNMGLFSSDYHENDQVYKGDFKMPFDLGTSVSGYFKFGGEYRYNYHTNAQSTPYGNVSGPVTGGGTTTDPNTIMGDSLIAHFPQLAGASGNFTANFFTTPRSSNLYDSFLSDRFGRMYWVVDPTILNYAVNYLSRDTVFRAISGAGGWYDGIYQNYPNDYKYIERYYAAYLMSELDFGPDFMVVGGARFEEDKSLFAAWDVLDDPTPSGQRKYPVTAYPENHYWLPMVTARYNVLDWVDVRYAYTQTLARPGYSQLDPHFYLDYSHNNVWAGNPDLRPAQAYNHDVEITFHSNTIGLLTIGGFYKTISHFTFSTNYPMFDNPKSVPAGFDSTGSFVFPNGVRPNQQVGAVYTYINSPYKAYVKGVEADFETRFWYLPAPLNGVVFGINYTHISSSATYPFLFPRTINNPTPPPRFTTILIDSSRSGRLIDQPNDIMNSYIGYDYKGFSARVSFVFQGNSVNYVGGFPYQDGFTRNYFRIDASVRQMLPWAGLQLYADANNLNSESNIAAQQTIGGFTSENFYGLTADLGVRVTL